MKARRRNGNGRGDPRSSLTATTKDGKNQDHYGMGYLAIATMRTLISQQR